MPTRALSAEITPGSPGEATLLFPLTKLTCTGLFLDAGSTGIVKTGWTYVEDGSAGAPSFAPFSDQDTGFYFPAANQIGIATGGALRGTWSSAGLSMTGMVTVNSGSTNGAIILRGYPSDPNTYGGLWIGVTPTDTNYSFLATGGGTSFCNAAVDLYFRIANANRLSVLSARLQAHVPLKLQGYTVGTLPAGSVGDTAYVTDAVLPTYGATLTGGGAVTVPVFYNGTAWISA